MYLPAIVPWFKGGGRNRERAKRNPQDFSRGLLKGVSNVRRGAVQVTVNILHFLGAKGNIGLSSVYQLGCAGLEPDLRCIAVRW